MGKGNIDTDMVRSAVMEKIVARIPVGPHGARARWRAAFLPCRRRSRLHHGIDFVDQWRPADVLAAKKDSCALSGQI
jgi:hypothetical protein